MTKILTIKWGTTSYGYTTCSAWVDGKRIAACNGGGYDMRGTVVGLWAARNYRDRLVALKPEDMPEQSHYDHDTKTLVQDGCYFYGLTFHDPYYDAGKAIIGTDDVSDRTFGGSPGQTVAEAEAAGKSLGLERYQAFYRAASKIPTDRHTVPSIDGACGMSSVERILKAIGIGLERIDGNSKRDVYLIHDRKES